MEGLTEGRIVHYVMHDGNSKGQHRPAIVVNAWQNSMSEGRVNLQVFTDSINDGDQFRAGIYWATSIRYSEEKELGTWHWIEKA